MHSRAAAVTRLALILLLMGVVVFTQAASSEETHQHSTQHCCGLCHAGMPFVQTVVVSAFAPTLSHTWLEMAYALESPHELSLNAPSSRAPPC
jgi:hypothetical protein